MLSILPHTETTIKKVNEILAKMIENSNEIISVKVLVLLTRNSNVL